LGYNRVTTGKIAVGRNRVAQVGWGTIARTDTVAKSLFKLPAKAIVLGVIISGPAVSDAGTTATITVGKTGTNNWFVAAYDVKGGGGLGAYLPAGAGAKFGDVGFGGGVQVVGIYAETGGASTVGGPWNVFLLYLQGP
jgi:hypothetical protein